MVYSTYNKGVKFVEKSYKIGVTFIKIYKRAPQLLEN